jgi:predicted RNA-binding protein with PUA-like domain
MLCLKPFRLVSLIGDNILYTHIRRNKLKKEMLMAYFLAKTDPKTYSIDNLEHDKRTVWDGVRNAAALLAIRAMHSDDEVLIYHSQGEATIVGLARVVSVPRPDPNDAKSWVVDLEFMRRLAQPITLHEIKESHLFDDWVLVRQGRLSTMSVPENVVSWLKEKKAL